MRARVNRRERLFKEDPKCRFCGVEMILPQDVPGYPRCKKIPDNMCTIEHLYSRLNSKRGKVKGDTTTICCKKCNLERSYLELEKFTIDELQRLARGEKIRKNFEPIENLLK